MRAFLVDLAHTILAIAIMGAILAALLFGVDALADAVGFEWDDLRRSPPCEMDGPDVCLPTDDTGW